MQALESADLLGVQVDSHELPVEGGRAVVPRAVDGFGPPLGHLTRGAHRDFKTRGVLSDRRELVRVHHLQRLAGESERPVEAQSFAPLGVDDRRVQGALPRGEGLIEPAARPRLEDQLLRQLRERVVPPAAHIACHRVVDDIRRSGHHQLALEREGPVTQLANIWRVGSIDDPQPRHQRYQHQPRQPQAQQQPRA